MRQFIRPIGAAAIVFLAGFLGAPVVRADDASFVAAAHKMGFQQFDDVLIRMGRSACRFLQPNLRRHPFDVAEHIRRHANVEPEQARQFLVMSANEYCPALTYRLDE